MSATGVFASNRPTAVWHVCRESSMRLCSVTSLMKFYPLPEALAVIAEAGYQGVELWGGLPHAYTDDFYDGGKLDQATVDRCRKLLNDSGLEPVSFLPEQCFY